MGCTPPLARNNHEPGFRKPSEIVEDVCKLTCQCNPCAMVSCKCPYAQCSQQSKAGLRFTNFKPILFSNVLVIVTVAIKTYRFCAYHTNLMMDAGWCLYRASASKPVRKTPNYLFNSDICSVAHLFLTCNLVQARWGCSTTVTAYKICVAQVQHVEHYSLGSNWRSEARENNALSLIILQVADIYARCESLLVCVLFVSNHTVKMAGSLTVVSDRRRRKKSCLSVTNTQIILIRSCADCGYPEGIRFPTFIDPAGTISQHTRA